MATDVDMMRAVASAPMRTLRLRDMPGFAQNTWRVLDRLVEEGALVRLAHGIYTAPPDGRDGRRWKPPLESAALAVATARFGDRNVALMGVSAARHWAVIPRALGVATVAVPRRGYAPLTLEAGGLIKMVPRDLDRLVLVLQRTSLGEGLVTTVEQTLFDLVARARKDGVSAEVAAAIDNLTPLVRVEEFAEIVAESSHVPAGARSVLRALEAM